MKYSKLLSKFLSLLLLTLSLSTACSPQESPSEPSVPVQTSASEPETSESPAPTSASVSPESSAEISEAPDYSAPANWAYLESEEDERKPADVFFICPSVYGGSEDACNMSLSDEDTKESFMGAINMEKGIYDDESRFFAPYYRQIGLNVYEMEEAEREP